MSREIDRRQFLAAALATGAAVSLPVELLSPDGDSVTASSDGGRSSGAEDGFFLVDTSGHPRRSTCEALCARIVPSGSDPDRDPGAREAGAVTFIDLFLSAFELPSHVADNPAVYLQGRFSGRNPYPDPSTGRPSHRFPGDDFVARDGRRRFLTLTPFQELSWRIQLYGPEALDGEAVASRWRRQVGSLIPLASGIPLRTTYADGLDAFDQASEARFAVSFANASPAQQDEVLADAASASTGGAPSGTGASVPAAAVALFPQIVTHTFQACYAQPAYGGNRGGIMWRAIGWEGDTQPLGNSVYDRSLARPGQGPNEGFGDASVYRPRGGYRQFRPVSGPG